MHKCIAIEKLILNKMHSGLLGLSDSDNDSSGGNNNDNVDVLDEEGDEEGGEEGDEI